MPTPMATGMIDADSNGQATPAISSGCLGAHQP
jgi:hypothetical protein